MPDPVNDSSSLAAKSLEAVLIGASIAAAVWVFVSGYQAAIPIALISFWCLGLGVLGGSGRFPEIGLYVFVALIYGTPRYAIHVLRPDPPFHGMYDVMVQIGVPNLVCVLGMLGWGTWMVRRRRPPTVSDRISLIMVLFILWLGVSFGFALTTDLDWDPHLKHHPQNYLHALVLFILASHVLTDSKRAIRMSLVICLTVVLRGLISNDIYREGDVSSLAVMALPLGLLGFRIGTEVTVKGCFALLSIVLVSLIVIIENRAAGVGLVALLGVLWIQSRHKWKAMLAGTPVLVIIGVLFTYSGFWKRFTEISNLGSDDSNTVYQRFEIWDAGWKMFLDHPLLGVGPGNFHHLVQSYHPGFDDQFTAHNNYLQMLAESGAPGLGLYLLLFAATLLSAREVAKIAGPEWQGTAQRMLITGLVVYLVVGCFISRGDMGLGYLLCGWVVGIRGELFGRRDPIETRLPRTTPGGEVDPPPDQRRE